MCFVGHGRVVNLFQGGSPNVPLLRMFNFTKEHYNSVFHYPIDRLVQMELSNKPQPQSQLQTDTNNTNRTENLNPSNPLQTLVTTLPPMESSGEGEKDTAKNVEEKGIIEDQNQTVSTNDSGSVFPHSEEFDPTYQQIRSFH
jgi:hypothetical protein